MTNPTNPFDSVSAEAIKIIQNKCEQYWNTDGLGDPEIHAILEFIHRETSRIIPAMRRAVVEWLRERAFKYQKSAESLMEKKDSHWKIYRHKADGAINAADQLERGGK